MKKRDLALAFGAGLGAAVAVKMLKRSRTVNWDDVRKSVPHSDKSHFINIDGARVHYQEFGDTAKPPIILIHGFTSSVYVWKTVAPMLADAGFHVIAIDLLGFGYSEKPRWFDYSIASHARMISRFMNRLGIGRATVVGSSYGGAVALMLTLDYPETIEKLVLVDAVSNDAPKKHPIIKLASLPGVGELMAPFLVDCTAFMRLRARGSLAKANHYLITDERIESIRRPLNAADAHRSVLATSRNWHADRLERDAHLIKAPTLIIWGEEDTVVPIKHGYKLHENILNSRFVVVKDCGHVPHEEKSEIFTKLVSEFCRDRKGLINKKGDSQVRL